MLTGHQAEFSRPYYVPGHHLRSCGVVWVQEDLTQPWWTFMVWEEILCMT